MKKQKEKRKVCGRVYRRRTMIGIVMLALLTAGLNKIVSAYSSTISSYLGNGEATVTSKYDTEGWNAEYYEEKYAASADSQAAETIADEGIVLLKNTDNTLPLDKGSSVTPFGYRYTNPVYGGTGSGNVDTSMDYVWTAEEALSEYFDLNEEMSAALNNAAFMVMDSEAVTESKREGSGNGYSGASTDLVEFDASVYTDELLSAAEKSTAVVFIGREGGEGADLQYTSYADGTAHELRLTSYEKETLRIARETCNKLVVIINSSNAMELSEIMEGGEYEADAVIWIGGPGAMGFKSMAKIMCGETNPSGKTVDIFVADLTKDPTYVNTGNDKYDNKGMTYSTLIMGGFIEEEEGIYYGYRYYETACDIGAAGFDYEKAVVAPFGYGLSYTQFSQEITDFTENEDAVTISVTSTNIGTVSGKDVVEIYTTAPYTDLDIEYKIEKPTVVLSGYEKTDVLEPGESETVLITIRKEDLASYCYTRDNGDGTTGCYMLEAGEYKVSLRTDSHTIIDSRSFMLADTIWYDASNTRSTDETVASNQFEEVSAYANGEYAEEGTTGDMVMLTRADWDNTQPTAPTSHSAPSAVLDMLQANQDFNPKTDALLGDQEGSAIYKAEAPASEADNGLTLSDMRGLDYDDPLWDEYLDQIDYDDDDITDFMGTQGYCTTAYEALGIPYAVALDGPQGITKQANVNGDLWCAYPSEPIIAATWNKELARQMGESVGQEALTTKVTAWYAPGMNIHRSAFSGRNFEYYSEDPYLTGTIGAEVVSGAAEQGLICNLKHFAMNDQESNRVGLCTWTTEQSMREIGLRGFEICIKNAEKTIRYISDKNGTLSETTMGAVSEVLTAACYIGTTWCSNNYALVTEVLRNEWGFEGFATTDMSFILPNCDAGLDFMYRSGVDNHMATSNWYSVKDADSAVGQWTTRRAVKNMSYAIANSNAMQGIAPGSSISYGNSSWKALLYVANAILVGLMVLLFVLMLLRAKDEKKNPDKYRPYVSRKEKKAAKKAARAAKKAAKAAKKAAKADM